MEDIARIALAKISHEEATHVFEELLHRAEGGDVYAVYRAMAIISVLGEEESVWYETYIVRLLTVSEDRAFRDVLQQQGDDVKDSVCSTLIRDQWNVDDDEQYEKNKLLPETAYPMTKDFVFAYCK